MRKLLVAGLVGTAVVLAVPKIAQASGYPVFDVAVDLAIKALEDAATSAINRVETAVTGLQSSLTQTLDNGFTQNANYAKAQIGAQEQIADASNTAMARFGRDLRNAQIRDEHVVTPQACTGLLNGQSVTVAAGQSWRVSTAIGQVTDPRGEAQPGTPAWAGRGQALAAITQLHLSRYCSQAEQQAGLCATASQQENADQRAASLFGTASYNGQDGLNAANDYATTLIQPVPPAAMRSDQMTSIDGQDAQARRRNYNARISAARQVVNDVIASHTASVTVTDSQKQEMQALGMTPSDTAAWSQVLDLEVNRRVSGTDWAASLQGMPPKSVMVEIATELAMGNYIAWQNFQVAQQNAVIDAALLSERAERDLKPGAPVPSPEMAAQ